MATNRIRFRVEHNKAKTSFWYTLVAGNGNTVMTSKSTYDDYDNAKRAARRQIEALREAPLVLEFERDGETVQEEVSSTSTRRARKKVVLPEPSLGPFNRNLNPNR